MRAPVQKFPSMCILFAALILALACPAVSSAEEKAKPKPAAKPRQATDKLPELKKELIAKIDAAIPAQASATPKQARKILVVWRCEGFFHGEGIAAGNRALELMGQKTGAYTADVSRDYEVFDAANLAKYDAVVLNNTTHLKLPDDAKKQALLNFVRNGKGIVGIHAATDNFNDWPDAAEMMGGVFAGHPWGSGGTWAFRIDAPEHVLTQVFAGKGFKLKDEIYQFKDHYTRANRRVLLTLDLKDPDTAKTILDPKTGEYLKDAKSGKVKACRTDGDFAVSWIRNVGQGRVFYCSLGHNGSTFGEPTILKYYLDGIQFALGDLPADTSPQK